MVWFLDGTIIVMRVTSEVSVLLTHLVISEVL